LKCAFAKELNLFASLCKSCYLVYY